MLKSGRGFAAFLLVFTSIIALSNPSAAGEQLLFDKVLTISNWHVHASRHNFNADGAQEAHIKISKNTPDKEIQRGFFVLNGAFTFLRDFLVGDERVYEKEVTLQAANTLFVFLLGHPAASISMQISGNDASILPPQITLLTAEPPSIKRGASSTLSWQTENADACEIQPEIGAVDPSGSTFISPEETTTYTITATNLGGTTTKTATVTVLHPPTVEISSSPDTIISGESATLSWTSTRADSATIDPDIGSVPASGSVLVSPTETTPYTITVTGAGGTASASTTVTVVVPMGPPTVDFSAAPAMIAQGDTTTLSWDSTNADSAHIDYGIGVVNPDGAVAVSPEHTTTYTITVTGDTGSASARFTVKVMGDPEPLPEGFFGEQYADLIPPDATVDEYDSWRFSLITGLVQDLGGAPIEDVSITMLGHPEYGTVTTDAEGRFSIPVEGGGTLTIVYKKEGLISVHRKVYVPWNDIAIAEPIQMITEDPISTTITFDGNPETVVTHQSTVVTDEFGRRSLSMVFTGDNRAFLVDEKGYDIQELTTVTTRTTEFSTEKSMPAKLPPNSAYTYCAELSVDGAQRVRFDKPVVGWVDNFLGFNVGMAVPVGYYDRDRGVWVPSDNGVVVKLLDTDIDGIVDALDADGDDQPDDLNSDGSYIDEVKGLNDPLKYAPASTFWRFAVTHFTPWDCNWPYGPPDNAIAPNPLGQAIADLALEEPLMCPVKGASYVGARSRIYHEDIPIPGTDITLHYSSNRVVGYKTAITVPASGDTVPNSLMEIIVNLEVGGRTISQHLAPLSNQKVEFSWDGLDHMGRKVKGPITARVNIGFVYDTVYYQPGLFARSFAQAGEELTSIRARQQVVSWRGSEVIIHSAHRGSGTLAEGWSFSNHHFLFPEDPHTLFKGDGTISKNTAPMVRVVRDDALTKGIAIDSAGAIYWSNYHQIKKLNASDTVTVVAGNGTPGYSGDGGLATEAQLDNPKAICFDNMGNLYIVDYDNRRVRKVDSNGIITTVAGTGESNWGYLIGMGGPATQAPLVPNDIAADNYGNLYISNLFDFTYKVDPNGIITYVEYFDDPSAITVDGDGNFYVASDAGLIWKVDTNDSKTLVAGDKSNLCRNPGDGVPAIEACIGYIADIEVDAYGNLFFADWLLEDRIRMVNTSGIITTFAGRGNRLDDCFPVEAYFIYPYEVALSANGDMYVSDISGIRKIGPPGGFSVHGTIDRILFVDQNGLGYIISADGLHAKTIDLDTGILYREFKYNPNKVLISIHDQFGNQTTVELDSTGTPIAIISPDSIRTELTIDENNHLTRIAFPDGNFYSFEYTPDGFMTAEIEPDGNRFEHVFDASGRLTDATDEEGGHWNYNKISYENGDILSEVLTGEGNLTSYLDHTYSTGAYTSTITDPTGAETLYSQSDDGLTVNKSLPCGMELEFNYDLDPEYLFKYVKESTVSTPAGLERVRVRDKIYEDTDSNDIPDLITETTTVNGKITTFIHDTFQAQKVITSPENRTIITLYDPDTLLTESVSIPGLYDTAFGYDSRGRMTSIQTHTRQTVFTYNPEGFLGAITDPEGHTTTYEYDPVGRITGINRPDDGFVGFTYDNNGNMTVLTNPVDVSHGLGFNRVNRNSSYTTPLSGSYSYIYDKDRRLIQTNFPSRKQIFNIYDNARLSQIQTPEGNIDFTYLCGTKIDSITKGAESITYGYDGKLVTSETLSGTLNQLLGYTYSNDFDVSSFTYAGQTTSNSYDNDGLLTAAGDFNITRNAGNGLPEAVSDGALNLARIFNGYGEVEGQDYIVSSENVASWALTRDNNGRIIGKTETVEGVTTSFAYTYDWMGRLLTVTKDGDLIEEYSYDLSGTRISETNTLRGLTGRTFSYSDEDHLLTAGDMRYEYDLDGFLTNKTNQTNETDKTSYVYSSRGELLTVNLPDGRIIEYQHDPMGRRIAKKIGGVIVEKYLWQGLTRLLAVFDGADNLLMRFEYAGDRMPVAVTTEGVTYYLAYDQVGSLRVVADSAGDVVKRIDYDSFGNIIADTNESFKIPFGFAGGLHDRDTGLVRFGYRDYNPDMGRWAAKDPIGFAGGDTDFYGYCLNDPINWIDPSGLFGIGDIVSGAVSVATVAAKRAGYITGAGAATLAVAFAPLADLISPSTLLEGEVEDLRKYNTMKDIEELERRIEEVQRFLEPYLDRFHVEYDWNNTNPCP